jgi:hypothetical protein
MKLSTKALGIGALLIVVLSICFFFFYPRSEKNLAKQRLILTPEVINKPLPQANLVNISGQRLDDEKLRRGRVILVFAMIDCEPCDDENRFLKTVIGSRQDVSFIYVIPFGNKQQALQLAQNKYAVETFYDSGSMLSKNLEIYQVPIKVFLEDGVIKKVWLEATVEDQKQAEFKDWLRSL